MKVLEKRTLDVEASNKLNKEEVERLEATLATTQRERNAEKEVSLVFRWVCVAKL